MLFLAVISLTNVSMASVTISFRGRNFINIRLCYKMDCIIFSKPGQRTLITNSFDYIEKRLAMEISAQPLGFSCNNNRLFLALHTTSIPMPAAPAGPCEWRGGGCAQVGQGIGLGASAWGWPWVWGGRDWARPGLGLMLKHGTLWQVPMPMMLSGPGVALKCCFLYAILGLLTSTCSVKPPVKKELCP